MSIPSDLNQMAIKVGKTVKIGDSQALILALSSCTIRLDLGAFAFTSLLLSVPYTL
jgi:hypothetical protein